MFDDTSESPNPFPGLRAFEPDEDHLFFGREDQIDELLTRLRKTRFLSVVGTSGSGKSSLIRSGLIPSLYSGFMTKAGSSWRVAVMRPGSDPIGNLAAALNDPQVLGSDEQDFAEMNLALLETTLHRSALGLVEAVRQARLEEGENLLVLADQFEELFRFKQNIRIRDSKDSALAFVKLLLEATQQDEVPVYVVLTMRSDFIGNCTEFSGLAEAINDGQYLVPRMTREERKAAIVGPVAVGGAEISPRLVLRLLNDVGDNPDQLPILQHALMRTWDRWEGHHADDEPVDLRHYEATGTMEAALSQHAEEAFGELDSAREQRIAELMFKALTDTGSDARGVRRPTPLAEICELTGAEQDEVIAVIERFRAPGRTFLMPPPGTPLSADSVIDISHESLMRTWERLIEWVGEEASSAQIYLGLSKAAALYQEGKAGLYRDPELQIAANWREKNQPTEDWAVRYDVAFERAMLFLKYSEKEHELEIAEKERQRRKQLLMAKRMMYGAAFVALIILGFGLYSFQQKMIADVAAEDARVAQEEAERQAEEANRQKREVEKQRQVAEDERAKALEEQRKAEEERERAEEQQRIAEEQEQIAVAERQRAKEQEREALEQKARAEREAEAAEAARKEAEAAEAEAKRQRAEASRLGLLALSRALAVQAPQLRKAEQKQLSALLALQAHRLYRQGGGEGSDPDVFRALLLTLGRLEEGEKTSFSNHGDAVRALTPAPRGRVAFTGGADGKVLRFDFSSSDGPTVVADSATEVRSLSVAAGGELLAVGGFDGSLRLFEHQRPEATRRDLIVPVTAAVEDGAAAAPKGAESVNALAFDGGGLLASGDTSGRLRLWAVDGGTELAPLAGQPGSRIHALAFAPGGDLLAAAAVERGILLWDLRESGAEPRQLGAGNKIRAVAFSGDGKLAGGTGDGPVLVWDDPVSTASPTHELLQHESGVTGLDFGRDSRQLASASLDGKVVVWDLELAAKLQPIVLDDNEDWVWSVGFVDGGARVVSGGADDTVRIWPTSTDPLAAQVCDLAGRNLSSEEWAEYVPPEIEYETLCPGLSAEAR
ncbi:MAG: hypothetical protein GY719_10560 [bacterium]|nr:hypothetical protein [bacterium]